MRELKAVILLLTFMFSTAGNATLVHYCHGEMEGFAYVKTDGCCKDEVKVEHKKKCCSKKEEKQEEKPCDDCEFEDLMDSSDFELPKVSIAQVDVVLAFIYSSFVLFTDQETETYTDIQYDPPLYDRDIPVLVQSFLI